MRPLPALCALLSLSIFATMAAGATWDSGENDRGACTRITQDTLSLRITCAPRNRELFFVLSGGPFPGMKNVDDGNDSMMMWIEQSDGRTGRHPIDGYYFGPDRSFVGKFIVSDFVLDEFRRGAEMRLTAPTGQQIAAFGMTGTGKARGHFKEACGI